MSNMEDDEATTMVDLEQLSADDPLKGASGCAAKKK